MRGKKRKRTSKALQKKEIFAWLWPARGPTAGELLAETFHRNPLLAPPDLQRLPRRKRRHAKAAWFAGQGMREVHRREYEIKMAVLDAWAWAQLEHRLRVHEGLVPYLDIYRALAPGFGRWWWNKMDPLGGEGFPSEKEREAIGKVDLLLRAHHLDHIEVYGAVGPVLYPVERAWAEWLQKYHQEHLGKKRGVAQKLKAFASKILPLPYPGHIKQEIGSFAHLPEAIRLCLDLFSEHLRPSKLEALNTTIVRLVDLLHKRGLSARKAHQVTGLLLGKTSEHIRLRYQYHTRSRRPPV